MAQQKALKTMNVLCFVLYGNVIMKDHNSYIAIIIQLGTYSYLATCYSFDATATIYIKIESLHVTPSIYVHVYS